MNDKEKVIKGLQCIVDGTVRCESCGYAIDKHGHYSCQQNCASDAINLLKEQEAVEPINSYGTFRCGNCRNIVGYNDGYGRGYQNNFCSKCGKAVKWK